MALTPYLLGEILDELARSRSYRTGSIFDQNFGLGVLADDLLNPAISTPLLAGYIRPWRTQSSQNSGVSSLRSGQDGFKVNLDVQQFKPEEINVKIVDDYIVVEGKHEERQDEHGYISRQFQRRYRIPDNVDMDALISKLSSDGVLSIEAPKKTATLPSKERVIQITQTNAPAVTSKTHAEGGKKAAENGGAGEKMDQ